MRKILVQFVIMTVCTLGAGLASAQTAAQSQVDRNKVQTERKETKNRKKKKHNSEKDDTSAVQGKQSDTTDRDPDAPENRVEYGGGG